MTAKLHTLSNGVRVVIDQMPHTKSAAVGMYFTVGSRHEKPEENGAAHFLEHMAFKGTKTRTVDRLLEEMEDLGAKPNAFTGKEQTCYYMTGLGRDAVTFARLLGDIVCNATLPAEEMEIERGAIIQEIGMYDDSPDSVASELAEQTAYPAQPYGAPILGPKENIKSFSRDVLKNFRDRHYHAGNLIVSVAGNVDEAALLAELEATVGKLASGPASTFQPAVYKGGDVREKRDTEQLHLTIVFNGCAMGDKREAAAELLAEVLTGGMSSRLFREIREKRGLVYGISAHNSSAQGAGDFTISAGTGKDEVKKLIPVLCDELNKVRTGGITQAELDRARASVLVSLARSEDSSMSRMIMAADDIHFRGRLVENTEKETELNRITIADIQAVARGIFSSTPTVVALGPCEKVEPYRKIKQRLTL